MARTNISVLLLSLLLGALATAGCSKNEAASPEQLSTTAKQAVEEGQFSKAEASYRELQKAGDATATRQLALLYVDQGQMLQAYPLLKQVAEQDPNDLEIALKYGSVLLALQKAPEARDIAVGV